MKKIIKITESDLAQIVKRVLNEQKVENINPKNLKLGDRGDDVKKLQQLLFDKGYLRTDSMVPTGFFGKLTNAALKSALSGRVPLTATPSFLQGQGVKKPTTVTQTTTQQPNKTQSDKPQKKSSYNLTPRVDEELDYIKKRGLDDRPFMIVDPKQNLLYFFDTGGVLIDYTQTVDGSAMQSAAQKNTVYSYSDWCKSSNLLITPNLCTHPTKDKVECENGIKGIWDVKTNSCTRAPYYGALPSSDRFLPKGIYTISSLETHKDYTGGENNVWSLKNSSGDKVKQAIHGIPNSEERLIASNELSSLLNKDLSSGKVPEKYLNNTSSIAKANQSYGCVGIPENFVDNPKVMNIVKSQTGKSGILGFFNKQIRVFVMGDRPNENYLVSSDNYFKGIEGNGQSCQNPLSVAKNVGTMV